MIKNSLLGTVIVASLLFSCKNDKKIETEEQKVSYGLGVNYGEGFKQQNLKAEHIDIMIKAINDFKGLKTDEERTAYQLGISLANSLVTEKLENDIDFDLMKQGIQDFLKDEKSIKLTKEQIGPILEGFVNKKKTERNKKALDEATKYMAENAKASGIKSTNSGLQYKINAAGDGKTKIINDYDTVKVKYVGKLKSGKEFDNSEKSSPGKPVSFVANQVIPGFTEGLKLMTKGGKYTFFIPPSIGYGEQAPPNIGPNEALIFEVELVDVKPGVKPQAAPSNPNGTPMDPRLQQQMMQQMQQQAQQQGK